LESRVRTALVEREKRVRDGWISITDRMWQHTDKHMN